MLKNLNLYSVYDSAEFDLITDLIVPLLQNSKYYLRGVGFFTSGWLKLAFQGIMGLIENGGLGHIVLSPILDNRDWEAFCCGEKAKTDEILKNNLEKQIDDIARVLQEDTLNALAWMIADDILQFRFAVARDRNAASNYHDKVAIFIDEEGDRVAIHGSFNDTFQGSLNGEAFSVFKSWENGQCPFVDQHHKRLLELWTNGNSQFRIFTIPEALKHKIMKLRTTSQRPYSINLGISRKSSLEDYLDHRLRNPITLHPYQEDAILSWVSSGCRGILEMATGTGKTLTALSAALNRFEANQKLILIILVPYLHLLEQWQRQCIAFGFNPVLCSSANKGWSIEVKAKIQDFNIGALSHICIIAVHDTASKENFLKATKNLIAEHTLLIADEVHGLGSAILRRAMIPNADMRLGLSATPKRWFDEEGTEAILNYFGTICFAFPIEKAIGKYLVPYEYKPELVHLNNLEMDEYEYLTSRITRLLSVKNIDKTEISEELKRLLLQRSRVIASAEEKIDRLINILGKILSESHKRNETLSHVLIYCAPGTHKKVLQAVAKLGLKCHEFVHTVSLNDRQEILQKFESGDIQALIAVKCLDQGVDIPSTKTAFLLASTSNPMEFVQRRGRILRLAYKKQQATIYDFIIVPRPEQMSFKREIDAGIIRREMPRFSEFASAAMNEFEARSIVWDLLNQYELLNFFEMKPWDMYHSNLSDNS